MGLGGVRRGDRKAGGEYFLGELALSQVLQNKNGLDWGPRKGAHVFAQGLPCAK